MSRPKPLTPEPHPSPSSPCQKMAPPFTQLPSPSPAGVLGLSFLNHTNASASPTGSTFRCPPKSYHLTPTNSLSSSCLLPSQSTLQQQPEQSFRECPCTTLVLRQCFHLQTKPIPSLPGIFQASSCLSSFIFTPYPRHSCYPSLTRCLAVPTTPQAHSCPPLPSLCMWLLQSMSGGFSVPTSDRLVREDLTRKPAHHSWSTPSTLLFFFAELVFLKLTHKSTCSTQAGVCLPPTPPGCPALCLEIGAQISVDQTIISWCPC